MTAKEYLLEIQKFKRTADALGEKAEALRTEMEGLKAITYDRDRVQVSPTNRVEELMPRLVELEEKYGEALYCYHERILASTEIINSLQSKLQARLLILRYFEDRSWEQITKELNPDRDKPYAYEHVIRLHGKALVNFSKKFRNVIEMSY